MSIGEQALELWLALLQPRASPLSGEQAAEDAGTVRFLSMYGRFRPFCDWR